MSQIYLAARFTRKEEMCQIASQLSEYGHQVTSMWHGLECLKYPEGATAEFIANDGTYHWREHAKRDLSNIRSSDIVIMFTSPEDHGTGGRHVEFGYALAYSIQLVIVGPVENIFQTLPSVEVYPTWDDLSSDIGSLCGGGHLVIGDHSS